MGSMCCKKFESPYSPKLPDFNKLFDTCAEQLQLCQNRKPKDDPPPLPCHRKFSCSDISPPLPLGCTIPPPIRPPRKRKKRLSRTMSLVLEAKNRPNLFRSKSIHCIDWESKPCEVEEETTAEPIQFDYEIPYANIHPYFLPLEPIIESALESYESASSQIIENKKNFLASLIEENNNLPSRKSSITESLREFETSLYDMLEQESVKDDDEAKWRPQIPVISYH